MSDRTRAIHERLAALCELDTYEIDGQLHVKMHGDWMSWHPDAIAHQMVMVIRAMRKRGFVDEHSSDAGGSAEWTFSVPEEFDGDAPAGPDVLYLGRAKSSFDAEAVALAAYLALVEQDKFLASARNAAG